MADLPQRAAVPRRAPAGRRGPAEYRSRGKRKPPAEAGGGTSIESTELRRGFVRKGVVMLVH